MRNTATIERIINKPEHKLVNLYGTLAKDKAHLELSLRNKGIHELLHDLEKLNGVTAIGAKLARTLRKGV